MRMSSGASAAYENPRSGRSSCMLETPRSSRIASARTPLSASWSRMIEKSPRRKRAWTPADRRKRSKYGRTVVSRSIAITLPLPFRSRARRVAWPPAPKVASTRVSPRSSASNERTSSARTGTWSVVLGCKTFGNMLCTSHDLLQLSAPGGAIPDLEPVAHPDDDHLAAEPGVRDQRRRHHHAALLVGPRLDRAGVVEALEDARLVAEPVEPGQARLDQLLPVARRVRLDAGVEPAGEDDAAGERLPELRRQGEPVLVVEGVVVFAEQHRSTLPHFTPQAPTTQPRSPQITHSGAGAWIRAASARGGADLFDDR